MKIQVAIGYISEDKLHDKRMSQHIVDDTINWIKKCTTCKEIIVISDGCRSQFKSRHMAGWMSTVPQRHGIKFQWHFHCSCHGKCLCDSVGGHWKHVAEDAVDGDEYTFENAKKLYTFLQLRIAEGKTRWKLKKVKRGGGEKAEKYGMCIQHEVIEWIPRPGEVGSVSRANVKEYLAMKDISLWHRFVATENGKLYVSELSCFCKACKAYKFDECPFIADTGKATLITPEVDLKKIKKEWTAKDAIDMAPRLKKED
jgi:hypothetical protein